jgi:hypothetical protein
MKCNNQIQSHLQLITKSKLSAPLPLALVFIATNTTRGKRNNGRGGVGKGGEWGRGGSGEGGGVLMDNFFNELFFPAA